MTAPAPSAAEILDIAEPSPPAAAPAPAPAEPQVVEPEVIEPAPPTAFVPAASTEVAKVADTAPMVYAEDLDEGWAHDWLVFKGDKLAIRKPLRQTGVALHFASSPYAPEGAADRLSGLLIARILGPESYIRVMWRMMDPDDPDYTVTTVTELVGEVMKVAAEGWNDETTATAGEAS